MNDLQNRQLETLKRVLIWPDSSPKSFPSGGRAEQLLTVISHAVSEIDQQSFKQFMGLRDVATVRRSKRGDLADLWATVRTISRTARAISKTTPKFNEAFQLPREKGNDALLSTARKFAEAATGSAETFIHFGMAPDFIDDLIRKVKQVETIQAKSADGRRLHEEGSANLKAPFKRAMNAMRELDIVLSNFLKNDGPSFVTWKSVCHVKRARRKKAAAASA